MPPLLFDLSMRVGLSLLAIALCLFLIQASARFGFSRLLTRYALITHSTAVADAAIQLTPSDPDAQRARAATLNDQQQHGEAANSLAAAVALRYRDDYLWIELGNTREEIGDTTGALAALDQAVHWAPYYAHPRWQRGNLLLRMNRTDQAFADLRQAATANPKYFPNLIDLAWGISKGDLKTTESLVNIRNDNERLALIRYLAGKSFRDAFTLAYGSATTSFLNRGFEDPFVLNDVTFGWIVAPEQKNRLTIDVSEAVEGKKSLRIIFDGDWNPDRPVLSQTIVVEPEKTYRISFHVKTKDLVSGGPPLITVKDATTNQLLGKSLSFPSTTNPWLGLEVIFTTLSSSQAAVVRLERNNCDSAPCPIFGTLWLDQFKIEQTKSPIKQ
ncbi:MAG TPA: carbohydrate binding domain-containing protein [Pyrinomonadaceae bacterium]|nr:carbohydrate binding domain-containing protein [Pyrinomonadaceae bacterium]